MRIFTLTVLVLAAAAVAFATEHGGEHHGLNWMDFLFRIINFIIFIAIIYKFGGKAIAGFFRGRREQIETQLNDLGSRKKEAEKRLRDVGQSIANIEQERAQILADFRSQGEALKASIIEKAHQAAEKIKVQAEMTAAQERKAAQEKI
ncbi:MAG: ATP synthase F0 subunit B, partial [Thermodesulfobacteriota bacterium]|nr:ATP synthase F0 subunit B [Thermodesulfobacteriota bacterium]